jgi:pyruvate kinase
MAGVERVLEILRHLETASPAAGPGLKKLALRDHSLPDRRTKALLGPEPAGRHVRIMVTVPTEAGYDYELVRDLVEHGMDCMRVNCAHDDPRVWDLMIRNLERARRELGEAVLSRNGPAGTQAAHRAGRAGPPGNQNPPAP